MVDIGDLKAAFEQTVGAFNSRNLDACVASAHDRVVLFGAFSPFPAEGKEAVRQVYETFFTNYERASFTVIYPQFHVTGSTGVAWGYYALTAKPVDGPVETSYGRYTFTFAQPDGKWAAVAAHFSWLPSET
jgi:ketosteroid isomerase-like protein